MRKGENLGARALVIPFSHCLTLFHYVVSTPPECYTHLGSKRPDIIKLGNQLIGEK